MYELAAKLDPDSYLELATAVFAEMALAGFTLVGETHYLHHQPGGRPYGEQNAMGTALAEAANRAGIGHYCSTPAICKGESDKGPRAAPAPLCRCRCHQVGGTCRCTADR